MKKLNFWDTNYLANFETYSYSISIGLRTFRNSLGEEISWTKGNTEL